MMASPAKVRRAVVMAHFDRDGLLDSHVRATLASVAATGADLILVSTHLQLAEPLAGTGVGRVIRRENDGYDFRSWQIGLRELGELDNYQEIILMNDSFYLAREDAVVAALEALRQLPYDIGSMTASREFCYHMQSYFLVFRPRAFRSTWFKNFWDGIAPTSDREAGIRNYELPLAAQARSAGLRVGALQAPPILPNLAFLRQRWSTDAQVGGRRAAVRAVIDALRGRPGWNPTLDGWLATAKRCGLIKVELLRTNPRGADLSQLGDVMEPGCLMRARRHIDRISGSVHAAEAAA